VANYLNNEWCEFVTRYMIEVFVIFLRVCRHYTLIYYIYTIYLNNVLQFSLISVKTFPLTNDHIYCLQRYHSVTTNYMVDSLLLNVPKQTVQRVHNIKYRLAAVIMMSLSNYFLEQGWIINMWVSQTVTHSLTYSLAHSH